MECAIVHIVNILCMVYSRPSVTKSMTEKCRVKESQINPCRYVMYLQVHKNDDGDVELVIWCRWDEIK